MSNSIRSLALSMVLFTLVLCVDSTSAAAFKRVHQGEQAPAFTLPSLAGDPVDLNDYREGPLTILTFWALWSPKSGPLLEDIAKLAEEFSSHGVRVVTVNAEGMDVPADLESQIQAFLAERSLKLPVLLDKGLEQYNIWGVIATPSTAFLVEDLEVAYEFSGRPTSAYENMRAQAREILGIAEEQAAQAAPKRERYKAPKSVMLNYGLSRTQFKRGQFSKAARKLKKVLKKDPKYPDAHALQGVILLAQAQDDGEEAPSEARAAFAKAAELDDTLPLGQAGLAHFALADGDVAKALELTRRALEFTEVEELPELEPATAAAEGDPQAAADAAAAATEPGEVGTTAEAQAGDSGGAQDAAATASDAPPTHPAFAALDQAEATLTAGDAEDAAEQVGVVVDALLGIPEGAGGGARAKLMKKMRQLKKDAE